MPPVLETVRTTLWLIVALFALASLSLYLLLARRHSPQHRLPRIFTLMLLGVGLTGSGLLAPLSLPEPFALSALAAAALGLVVFAAAIARFVLDANDLTTPDRVDTRPLFPPPRLRLTSRPAAASTDLTLAGPPPTLAAPTRRTPTTSPPLRAASAGRRARRRG
jgi:uncharacterized membrane protein YidH (DUF202 family)